jgi:hypothetical protein
MKQTFRVKLIIRAMQKAKFVTFSIIFLLGIAITAWVNTWKSKATIVEPVVSQASQPSAKKTNEQFSGDASVKLQELIKKQADGKILYTFKVTNTITNITKTVFETIEDQTVFYSIPDNTWSPDNKLFFITKETPSEKTYLVFRGDGSIFSDKQQSLDVANFWSKTKYTLKIKVATGWGGDSLLILNTTEADGSSGPSFWFVTDSHSFLQLSH